MNHKKTAPFVGVSMNDSFPWALGSKGLYLGLGQPSMAAWLNHVPAADVIAEILLKVRIWNWCQASKMVQQVKVFTIKPDLPEFDPRDP